MTKKTSLPLLQIKKLSIRVEGEMIVEDCSLTIHEGEIHALMGPNGSGKSTLASALMGHPKAIITKGTVHFRGKNLMDLATHERAALGLFLGFQYPKEIPGVNLVSFLRAADTALKQNPKKKIEPEPLYRFKQTVIEKMEILKMPKAFLNRNTNEGFSGGEKKKAEILQMLLLKPRLAILDEIDSGLDIDALEIICKAIQAEKSKDQGVLMITHYERMLHHLKPDFVHIMMDGKIVKSGTAKLARELEKKGYDWIRKELGGAKSGLTILK